MNSKQLLKENAELQQQVREMRGEQALMRELLYTSLAEERGHDREMMRRGGAEALEQFAKNWQEYTGRSGDTTGISIAKSARHYAAMLRRTAPPEKNHDEVNMALITLRQWGDRLPVPPSTETLRRWHRDGKIYPPSGYDGYRILVEETAVRINPRTGRKTCAPATDSLTARIKHGRTEKKS